MSEAQQNFTMFAGNRKRLVVTVTDLADLTGITSIKFEMFPPRTGAAVLQKAIGSGITIPGPNGKVFHVDLMEADTDSFDGRYHYETEIRDAANDPATSPWGFVDITQP